MRCVKESWSCESRSGAPQGGLEGIDRVVLEHVAAVASEVVEPVGLVAAEPAEVVAAAAAEDREQAGMVAGLSDTGTDPCH